MSQISKILFHKQNFWTLKWSRIFNSGESSKVNVSSFSANFKRNQIGNYFGMEPHLLCQKILFKAKRVLICVIIVGAICGVKLFTSPQIQAQAIYIVTKMVKLDKFFMVKLCLEILLPCLQGILWNLRISLEQQLNTILSRNKVVLQTTLWYMLAKSVTQDTWSAFNETLRSTEPRKRLKIEEGHVITNLV